MIQLKTYNRKQLQEFISSGDFQKYDFLPITKHRAESHISNPKASDDQTLLILAFYEEKLAGYVGCFPDSFIIDGKEFTYAWLSTLYVNNEFREKRVPKKLLKKVFEEYNDRIAITEFTREAEALYAIMGVFEDVFPKEGKRYYFRADAAKMIPEKKPDTKVLTPLFRIVDVTANSLLSFRNSLIKKPKFRFEILDHIDTESSDFISKFQSRRTGDEINIFIKNPWVLEGKKEGKYLFSSYAETFKYFWIKIYDDHNVLTAGSLLLLRDGYLKIPYLFSQSGLDHFIDFLNYFIVKNKVKALTSYQKELNIKLDKSKTFPQIYKRNFKREYLFHKQLLKDLPEGFDPHYQDGDGDCMMT